MSLLSAVKSNWGNIYGVEIHWWQNQNPKKSPKSNAFAYAECALSTYGGSTSVAITFFVSGPKFTIFFTEPIRDRCRTSLFPIFDNSTGSCDIRSQIQKLS